MEKLKRTFSFKKSKKRGHSKSGNSTNYPIDWLEDERKVRSGSCNFLVKYLGCVEVFESRGMAVCEEAVRLLRANAKKMERFSFRKKVKRGLCPVLAMLYISGDSLRVVEHKSTFESGLSKDDNQGLIIDQTIEKVSFCAPDRNSDRGFSYICRDGTTKRWMCHSFQAINELGERLSHAVGCAFAVCLEKKQQRDKEAVNVDFNQDKTSFTRLGSFRQASLTERMQDPQSIKLVEPVQSAATSSQQQQPATNRPRPSPLNSAASRGDTPSDIPKLEGSPNMFKRGGSLRLDELPSNLRRQAKEFDSGKPSTCQDSEDVPDAATLTFDPIAAMCQQLSGQLTDLTLTASQPTNSSYPTAITTDSTVDEFGATKLSALTFPSSAANQSAVSTTSPAGHITSVAGLDKTSTRNGMSGSPPPAAPSVVSQSYPVPFSSTNPFITSIPANTNSQSAQLFGQLSTDNQMNQQQFSASNPFRNPFLNSSDNQVTTQFLVNM